VELQLNGIHDDINVLGDNINTIKKNGAGIAVSIVSGYRLDEQGVRI
jgi:hypothetical protein